MQSFSIKTNEVPQNILKELRDTGVRFDSDGNSKDISRHDIVAAYMNLKEIADSHKDKNLKKIAEQKIELFKQAIKLFAGWVCSEKTAEYVLLEKELDEQAGKDYHYTRTLFCNESASGEVRRMLWNIYPAFKQIEGEEVLFKNNIRLVVDSTNYAHLLGGKNLRFEINDGNLKITGNVLHYNTEYKVLNYTIDKSRVANLKEIKIKDFQSDLILSAAYNDGKEEYIATIGRYNPPHVRP